MELQSLSGDKINKVIMYTDGGARGNPGPSACGYVIDGKPYGDFLGRGTNNEAEYQGVIRGLRKIRLIVGEERAFETKVEVRLDSELIELQLTRVYKVKEQRLQILFLAEQEEIRNFRRRRRRSR